MFFNCLAYVPSNLLIGVGRPDLPAKFHIFELPFYIGIAWFLVARFGVLGAALACSIRVSLDFALLVTAACWLTRTPPRLLAGRDLRRAAGALVALAASLAVLWASTRVFITDAIFTLLLGGVFILAAWHYALDTDERWQIRVWLRVAR